MDNHLKKQLSLAFNRHAVTSHMFRKDLSVVFVDVISVPAKYGKPEIEGSATVWAETSMISEDRYTVNMKTKKKHNNNIGWYRDKKDEFYEETISANFDGEDRTIFSSREAIEVLKLLEKEWQKEGYTPSTNQPLKKHIYTHKKIPAPKLT